MTLRVIVLLIPLLLLSACREEKMEVLNDIYISKPDSSLKINKNSVKESFKNVSSRNGETGKVVEAEVFVNESGAIDKVNILTSMDNQFKHSVVEAMKNLRFEPAVLNGQKVKSQSTIEIKRENYNSWQISFKNDMNANTKDLPSSIKEAEFLLEADQMPEPIGGIMALAQKIRYPEIAKRAGIEGKVFVEAFINEQGDVVHTSVVKGLGAGLDEAAVEAVQQTKFKPAVHNGNLVKTKIVIPIMFKLQ